jgi:hypothetical protein
LQTKQSLKGKANQYEEHLYNLLGNAPLPFHFLDLFLQDYNVVEAAKISCLG